MPRGSNQKLKLLYLLQYLQRSTDEEHPASVDDLIRGLSAHDVPAERKSIYSDMEALQRFGLDVQNRKGKGGGWFLGKREFELPELKLLVDAVQSSRFITRKKSDALIRKLEHLSSVHQARQLQRQVYVSNRIKVMNESIYYNVDKLHTAIAGGRAVTFRYFDYDMYRNRVFRHNGERYTVSPYGLIWSSENYYLAAYHHASGQLRHYRVDKMWDIALTAQPRQGEEKYGGLDVAQYAQKHFGMFAGEERSVTLRCRSTMAGVVLDRFGQEAILVPDGPDHFRMTVPVVLSPQFFGWLFGLEEDVVLCAPQEAVEEYRRRLASVAALYANT